VLALTNLFIILIKSFDLRVGVIIYGFRWDVYLVLKLCTRKRSSVTAVYCQLERVSVSTAIVRMISKEKLCA